MIEQNVDETLALARLLALAQVHDPQLAQDYAHALTPGAEHGSGLGHILRVIDIAIGDIQSAIVQAIEDPTEITNDRELIPLYDELDTWTNVRQSVDQLRPDYRHPEPDDHHFHWGYPSGFEG